MKVGWVQARALNGCSQSRTHARNTDTNTDTDTNTRTPLAFSTPELHSYLYHHRLGRLQIFGSRFRCTDRPCNFFSFDLQFTQGSRPPSDSVRNSIHVHRRLGGARGVAHIPASRTLFFRDASRQFLQLTSLPNTCFPTLASFRPQTMLSTMQSHETSITPNNSQDTSASRIVIPSSPSARRTGHVRSASILSSSSSVS